MFEFPTRTPVDLELDRRVTEELVALRTQAPVVAYSAPPSPIPQSVDLSSHLRYIRFQGGAGCWGYAMLAVWDIMNDMACPYSPNLSMRPWLMLHNRRDLWETTTPDKGMFTPDGRFHKMTNPEYGFFQSFGNTTEGNDPTLFRYPSRWSDGGWTTELINEAMNYRLASLPQTIDPISSANFVACLANNHPFRISFNYTVPPSDKPPAPPIGHWVAVVGYDKATQTFKWVNSAGDKWAQGGFQTLTFQEVDNKSAPRVQIAQITGAEFIDIIPPRPVPAARIHLHHVDRSNVHLWLSCENSPLPKTKIWPHNVNDNSTDLYFTVRLPSEFVWPPSPENRIVMDLYDEGTYSQTSGTLLEFTAAFGDHTFTTAKLPIAFKTKDRLRITIP